MRRARLSITRRLIPIWLSLWLLAAFGGPAAAWQHFDGTFCAPCTSSPRAPVLDDDCEGEARIQFVASTPDDCRECCAPVATPSFDDSVSTPLFAAIVPAPFAFEAPARRELVPHFRFAERRLDALPRPPPRGRAPPVWFSISPFCRSEI